MVSNAMVAALKSGPSTTSSGFGSSPFGLFDARRFGDLTALERMTAGMSGGASGLSDHEMADVTPSEMRDEMAMDVE